MHRHIKTAEEIQAMRVGGGMLATVLDVLKANIGVGITTKALADIAAKELRALGGEPAFLGYQGFPDVVCISINDEVVHGIPSHKRVIKDGDIVSLDFGVRYQGMITDGAISVIVGQAKSSAETKLISQTEASLAAGIAAVHDGVRVGDIGAAIQAVLEAGGYGIVRDMVGHGVGRELHEAPNIPNYGRPQTGPWLAAGMTIAIEPMATLGTDKIVFGSDGWVALTADNSRSAHFEHTVLITDESAEILTKLP